MVTKLEKPTRSSLVKLLELARVTRITSEEQRNTDLVNTWTNDFQPALDTVLQEYGLINSRKVFDAKCKRYLGMTITSPISINVISQAFWESPVGIRVIDLIGRQPERIQYHYSHGRTTVILPEVDVQFEEIRTYIMTKEDLSAETAKSLIMAFRDAMPYTLD